MLNRKRLGFKRIPILWGLLVPWGSPKKYWVEPYLDDSPESQEPLWRSMKGTTIELPGNWWLRKKPNHVSLPENISWGCDIVVSF